MAIICPQKGPGKCFEVSEKSGNFEMDILRDNPDQMREQTILVINGGGEC